MKSFYLRASIASIIAGAPFFVGAAEQTGAADELEEIQITGSRIITDDTKSPTPITSVEVEEALKTTPSDIPDALNKLPEIMGGRTPRNQGNASTNNGGNTLSLRNFGPQRTLVMLDGHRVPVSNQDGTVNVDILPDMLVQKVDIITGGASAIYGSDAVAGVVNYVIDKKFTGFKFKMDTGISKYGDGQEGQIGFAWGKDLFDGKGHFETSARYRAQAMIPISARPYGMNGQAWVQNGNGSAANPFVNVPYGRVIGQAQYGNVNCGTACPYNGYTFNQAGQLSPLVHGTRYGGNTNVESGGDGGYVKYGTFRSAIEMKNLFGRFDYDFSDSVKSYVQLTWAEARNNSNWINQVASSSAGRPNTLFADNPFLTPATQQQLGASIVCGTPAATGWRCLPTTPPTSQSNGTTPPAPPTTPFFGVPSYIWNNVGGEEAVRNGRMYKTEALQKNVNAELGFNGSFGGFNWDVFYSHGDSRLTVTNPHNTSNARYLAALDAVIAPAGSKIADRSTGALIDVSGQIVCWVSIQPQYAGLYPGCVPANIVDPKGPSVAAYEFMSQRTSWTLHQKLDNIGASIGGGLWGLGLPAGEIKANVSFDARWATYKMDSDALPTDFVDCTGLRMCLQASNTGATTPVLWVQNTNARVDAKNNVYEAALEINVPLLKDILLADDVSADLAGRHTKYSTFDAVNSWKLGLDWHFNSSIKISSTLSADIRAPNLNDLYQPVSISSTGFTDNLTGVTNGGQRLISQGNVNLTPEKARTATVSLVLTPSFLPDFNMRVDYYDTKLRDSITNISYGNGNVQSLCLGSAPSYNSPFCSLADRPITNPADPNYKTAANAPTAIYSKPFNSARQETHGVEAQFNYRWDMFGGKFSLRHLLGYQPTNITYNFPVNIVGTFPTWAVAPKLRQTTFLSFKSGDWTTSIQNQWMSSVSLVSSDNKINGNSQNYRDPKLKAYDVVDLTVSKRLQSWVGAEVYLNISNLNNARAPLVTGGTAGIPGLFYPTLGFYDDMGRYFTLGIKAGF